MLGFILVAVFMTFTMGLFLGTAFTCHMADGWKHRIAIFAIALTIGFGVASMFALEEKSDETTWNSGKCDCGGEWELVNVHHIKNGGNIYYWNCDECGHVIETNRSFK